MYKEIENVAVFSSKISPAAGCWPAALRVLNAGARTLMKKDAGKLERFMYFE